MTKRDLLAALVGAMIALSVAAVGRYGHVDVAGPAQAQTKAPDGVSRDEVRYRVLAIAAALASVAVDGERTAVAHNATADRVADLAERLADLEKRVAELEKKR